MVSFFFLWEIKIVKKNLLIFLVLLIALLVYLLIGSRFNIFIPCPIHEITNLYCPGCGVTRMLLAIINGDFYQAFRYNPLLFCLIPFLIFYYGNVIYSYYRKKENLFLRFEPQLWYFLIFLFILYGVVRNLPAFSYLIPTTI